MLASVPRVSDRLLNFHLFYVVSAAHKARFFVVQWTAMVVLDVDHVVIDRDPLSGRWQLSSLISYEIIRLPIGDFDLMCGKGRGLCTGSRMMMGMWSQSLSSSSVSVFLI